MMMFLSLLGILLIGCTMGVSSNDIHSQVFVTNATALTTSGAITGGKLGVGALPGAGVGLASAALLSAIQSFNMVRTNDSLLNLENKLIEAKYSSIGQQLLASYWDIRSKYHPRRDIFPAEVFFNVDSTDLSDLGKSILREIYELNKDRFSWSRFGIIVYISTPSPKNSFSRDLATRQAKAIGSYLVKLGLNPRRVGLYASIIDRPLVQSDNPKLDIMYYNAVEFVPLDLLLKNDSSG